MTAAAGGLEIAVGIGDGVEINVNNVLLSILSTLNSRRVRAIDLFRKIDRSGDGCVSAEEFCGALLSMGIEPTDKEFEVLMARLDKDGSGDVTLKEFDRALKAVARETKSTFSPGTPSPAARQPRRHTSTKEQELKVRQPLLERLDHIDEVMLQVQGQLNARKYRARDFFRTFDLSGDGLASREEFRGGLQKLGMDPSEEEFGFIMSRLDRDGSGDVTHEEFDKALKLVTKKAKAEGRSHEIDTWGYKRPADLPSSFDWASRSVKVSTSPPAMPGSPRVLPWHWAAGGPIDKANSATIGCGHIRDISTRRERPFDSHLQSQKLSESQRTPRVLSRGAATSMAQPRRICGRFEDEPATLPHRRMAAKMDFCSTAGKKNLRIWEGGGVKKFANSPMMQSTVDQVVLGRDTDFSGETKFDVEFTAMFDGCAGKASWEIGGR